MTPFVERLKTWWRDADKTQKTVSIVGSAFLLLLLGGVFYFSSRPQLAILFADLAPGQLAAVQSELDKQGVKYELDASRTVYVPRSEVTKLQAKLTAAGVAPDIQKFGYRDLSDIGMMNSPAVEGTKINAIHEGVLADMITTLDSVDEAIVRISPMDDSPFAVERRPATASILIRESRGNGATGDLGGVVAGMVANSVQGLSKENITVSTTEGRLLYDGQSSSGSNGMVTEKIAAQREEADRKRRELQAQLDTAFGRGATVVQVMVEMDFDKSNTTEEKRTPSETPVSMRSISEDLTGERPNSGGVTGMDSNTPGAPATSSNGSDYRSKQESREYLHDYTRTVREAVPGTIVAMGVSVLADSSRIADPAAQTTLQNTVQSFLGPLNDPEKFTANVNFVAFDQTASAEAAKVTEERAARDQMQQMFSLLPVAALLLVAFMVVRSVKRVAVTPVGGDFPPTAGEALPGGDPASAIAPSILEQLEQGQAEGQALTSSQMASLDGRDLDEYDEASEIEPLELGSKKVNKPLQQIYHLAENKPEEVANLVKAWMKEEVR